jgi:hypothetical protein
MPRTVDIPNRVITFKDVYGSATNSTITLVTQGSDVFENGAVSTILSNAFDTVTFHAGLPGSWHRTGGTNMVGGMTNASTFTNSLSTTVVYARTLYGDGSQLTGVLTTGAATTFSNITVIQNICNQGQLSNTGSATFGGGIIVTSGGLGSFSGGLSNQGSFSNIGNISNSLNLSNTGLIWAGTGFTTAGYGFISSLSTASISNIGNISTFTLNAGPANFTGTSLFQITSNTGSHGVAGLTTTNQLSNFGAFSNIGNMSNSGTVNFGNTLFVTALTTTNALSNTGNFSNIGGFSNSGTLGVASLTTLNALSNTGNFSNIGGFSNSGTVNFGNTLFVTALTTTNALSNSGNFSNNGGFSNTGTLVVGGITQLTGFSNTGNFTNTGNFSNTGDISTNTLRTGYGFISSLSTASISNIGNISTFTLNAGPANFTGTSLFQITSNTGTLGVAGLTTTNQLSNFGAFSNIGNMSNSGTVNLGNTLFVTALTTTNALSNTGNFSNIGNFSNSLNLSNTGLIWAGTGFTTAGSVFLSSLSSASISNIGNISTFTLNAGTANFTGTSLFQITSNTGTLGVAGITQLTGLSNTGNFTNTGNLSNTGLISTNQLNAGSISNNNLTFYDQYTASTGTFRFSTLTTLLALPNTSLLYFNNFVVAGAYVWPGQTIQALDWSSGCNGARLAPGGANFISGCNYNASNYYLVSNVTGGTPPYTIVETTPTYPLLSGALGLSTLNSSLLSGAQFGKITGVANFSGYGGTCNATFTLSDSSVPKFIRYLTISI